MSISYVVRELRNGADGMPATFDLESPTLPSVNLADGATPAVTIRGDGRYSFVREAADQPYRVSLTPDTEYQASTLELNLQDFVIGRANRRAPSDRSVNQVISNPVTSTATSYLVTTGLWTQTPHTSRNTNTNQNFTFPWTSAVVPERFYDPRGTVTALEHDRVFAVTRTPIAGVGGSYGVVTDACEDVVTDELGGLKDVALSCAVSGIAQDSCEQVHAPHGAMLAHLASALHAPELYAKQRYTWAITAAPSTTFHPQFGLTLAEKVVEKLAGSQVLDWNEAIAYGNPYPGHEVSVQTSAARVRTVMAVDATSAVALLAETSYWRAPGVACGAAVGEPPRVAIAGATTFAGVSLTMDGVDLDLDRTQLAALEWSIAAPGGVDYYQVELYEIARVFNGTFPALRQTYFTTTPIVVVDPQLLAAGRTYMFSISAHLGYPNVASGDFVTIAYPAAPLASSTNWSSTFTTR